MALAIACWVRDTALTTNQRDIEYKKACLNSIISVNTKLNTTLPGMEGYNPKEALEEKLFKGRENAKSTYEQYPWLIKG